MKLPVLLPALALGNGTYSGAITDLLAALAAVSEVSFECHL